MNLLFLHRTSSHPQLNSSTVSCFYRVPKTPIPVIRTTTTVWASSTTIPARDIVIDFGKYKGKQLGTLSSNYLKWVSNNLRACDFEEWAKLADQVLNDPVYRDRIEWELAERLLSGDIPSSSSLLSRSVGSDKGAVSELLEISERFGWDMEDKVGWSKMNFGLLGTSKGSRIPRIYKHRGVERKLGSKREKIPRDRDGEEARGGTTDGEKRRERRERLKSKRNTVTTTSGLVQSGSKWNNCVDDDVVGLGRNEENNNQGERRAEVPNPFPGRESLLKKVLNPRRR